MDGKNGGDLYISFAYVFIYIYIYTYSTRMIIDV